MSHGTNAWVALPVLFATSMPALASSVRYDDLGLWSSAAGGGYATESFDNAPIGTFQDGVSLDIGTMSFRGVALSGMGNTGVVSSGLHNGTPELNIKVSGPAHTAVNAVSELRITFAQPVSAISYWFLDPQYHLSTQGIANLGAIQMRLDTGEVVEFGIGEVDRTFRGYVFDQPVGSVTIFKPNSIHESWQELRIDDFAFVVPGSPTTAVAVGLGVVGLLRPRNRS